MKQTMSIKKPPKPLMRHGSFFIRKKSVPTGKRLSHPVLVDDVDDGGDLALGGAGLDHGDAADLDELVERLGKSREKRHLMSQFARILTKNTAKHKARNCGVLLDKAIVILPVRTKQKRAKKTRKL